MTAVGHRVCINSPGDVHMHSCGGSTFSAPHTSSPLFPTPLIPHLHLAYLLPILTLPSPPILPHFTASTTTPTSHPRSTFPPFPSLYYRLPLPCYPLFSPFPSSHPHSLSHYLSRFHPILTYPPFYPPSPLHTSTNPSFTPFPPSLVSPS